MVAGDASRRDATTTGEIGSPREGREGSGRLVWIVGTLGMVCAAILGVAAWLGPTMYRHRYGPLDAYRVLTHDSPSVTFYTAVYDENRFRQIRPGMTTREVESLVGGPLYRDGGKPLDEWEYSGRRGSDGFYHRRSVFFEAGKVVRLDRGYMSSVLSHKVRSMQVHNPAPWFTQPYTGSRTP